MLTTRGDVAGYVESSSSNKGTSVPSSPSGMGHQKQTWTTSVVPKMGKKAYTIWKKYNSAYSLSGDPAIRERNRSGASIV